MEESAVIVVSYNGWDHLERCLPGLLDQTLPFHSIVVVDNGSDDETHSRLARQYPCIELLRLESNRGFSGGVNGGLRHLLRNPRYSTIALVNNDVYLDHDWHEQVHRALAADGSVGSCATCLLQEARPESVDSCGIVWSQPGRAENYLSGQPAPQADDTVREIFGACAAAALYRREVFDQVGMFDAGLFAYQEDVDFALRAQAAGWRCLFVPGARGVHTGHGSNRLFPINGSYADYFNARNRFGVLVASLPSQEWRLHWRSILLNEYSTLLASVQERRVVATLAGFFRGLLRLPGILWRRLFNRGRTV